MTDAATVLVRVFLPVPVIGRPGTRRPRPSRGRDWGPAAGREAPVNCSTGAAFASVLHNEPIMLYYDSSDATSPRPTCCPWSGD